MLNTLRDVIEGLISDIGRLLLSLGAISIGMLTLIILISSVDGLTKESDRQIRTLGVDTFALINDRPHLQQGQRGLSRDTLTILIRNLPDTSIAPTRVSHARSLGSVERVQVISTNSELAFVRGWRMIKGRFITPSDLADRERIVVIDKGLAEDWQWNVGEVIMLGQTTFRIVGIVDTGSSFRIEMSDQRHLISGRTVFVPQTLLPYWQNDIQLQTSRLDAVYIKSISAGMFEQTLSRARRLIDPEDYGAGISWITPEDLVRQVNRLSGTLKLTLGGVSLLSVIMGCVTLVALMAANVKDRKSEIGLRRALGARRIDIQVLFVMEAVVVTAGAFLLGSVVAWVVLEFGRQYFPFPIRMEFHHLGLPLVVAVAAGLVASVWPARLAVRIEPALALREQ